MTERASVVIQYVAPSTLTRPKLMHAHRAERPVAVARDVHDLVQPRRRVVREAVRYRWLQRVRLRRRRYGDLLAGDRVDHDHVAAAPVQAEQAVARADQAQAPGRGAAPQLQLPAAGPCFL